MPQRIVKKVSKVGLTARWVTLVLAIAIGVFGIYYGITESLSRANENEQVQIERCEAGNKLRKGLQQYFEEELKEVESKGVPYYEKFLGGSEADIRRLRREAIEVLRYDIEVRFAPENCREVIE